jgi:hypothetical protein
MTNRVGQHGPEHDRAVMGRRSTTTRSLSLAAGVLVAIAALANARDADACGACYASSSESTVVNDHRMAFSIQKQRTILWDQIVYSGNPREFAYVIPAKPGTKLEASTSAWFSALETSTRPIIMAPQGGYGGGGYGGNDYASGGCCSSLSSADALSGAGSSENAKRENVEVVAQSVVGPYETVTIRSTDAQALQKWLTDHGYAVPESSGPIIASYVEAGLDFIALRLQPGKDVRAMEPIRIISPGTDISLPLRMMQIGAGAKVGITLYVIGEGRYRSASFPEAPIDFTKLIWDYGQARSNYQELSLAAMATENGRGFITEYADKPSFDAKAPAAQSGMTSNTGLASAYAAACPTYGEPRPKPTDPGADDAGSGADSAASDAGTDANNDDAGDAGTDASTEPEATLDAGKGPTIVAACDDLDVAVTDMALNDVWVTRLRANLPNAALADTLRLEAAPKQEKLDNVHYAATTGTIPTARIARLHTSRTQGTYALVALTAMVLSRVMRRKPKA